MSLSSPRDGRGEAMRDLGRMREEYKVAKVALDHLKETAERQAALLTEETGKQGTPVPSARSEGPATGPNIDGDRVHAAPLPPPAADADAVALFAAWEALEEAEAALAEDWALAVKNAETPEEVARLIEFSARLGDRTPNVAMDPSAERKDLLDEIECTERRLVDAHDAVFVDRMHFERQRWLIEEELRVVLTGDQECVSSPRSQI